MPTRRTSVRAMPRMLAATLRCITAARIAPMAVRTARATALLCQRGATTMEFSHRQDRRAVEDHEIVVRAKLDDQVAHRVRAEQVARVKPRRHRQDVRFGVGVAHDAERTALRPASTEGCDSFRL